MEMKDIVFDYFNIISKEYEMGYEKYKNDDTYKQEVNDIKKQVDEEYAEKRFDLPASLTKEKTQEIVQKKQGYVN